MRPRILVTGYEPFGGEPVNPSEQLVRALAAAPPDGLALATAVLPVDAAALPGALQATLTTARPHVVVALGQAAGRAQVDLERTARHAPNLASAAEPAGLPADNRCRHAGAPEHLRSNLPLHRLQRRLADAGLPVALSDDAGLYLCNALLYELHWRHPGLASVFVHLPALPSQAARRGRNEPSLTPDVTEACLRALLHELARS